MLSLREAQGPGDLEQVYRLNYRTFVEEIPQHRPNSERILIDNLLETSTCLIAVRDECLVGMVAISGHRPFSLDRKITDLDRYLPVGAGTPCEVRLLAVEPNERGGLVFAMLLDGLLNVARDRGFRVGLISATMRQMKLYRHLGAVPIGPRLGTDEAPFQGMLFTWDRLAPSLERLRERLRRDSSRSDRRSLGRPTGPAKPPTIHRGSRRPRPNE